MSDKKFSLAFFLIILLSLCLGFYYQNNQIITYDQTQMISKGVIAIKQGIILPYGNEASTMGNLPGSLSSLVIAIPLFIWNNPLSPVIFLEFIRLLSILFFLKAISSLFNKKIVLLSCLIYALNPWFLFDNRMFNVAYLCFGSTLLLWALVSLRAENQISKFWRFWWSAIAAIAVGICLQFHFSWPVLVALSGILYLRKDIKISYLGAFFGVFLVALSLIPYVIEITENKVILENPEEYASERYIGYGLVHVYPLFKAILYWLRFGSLFITNKALFFVDNFEGFIFYALSFVNILLVIVGVITVLFNAIATYKLLKTKEKSFEKSLLISSLIALLFAAGASTVVLNYWQIIVIFPFALIPLIWFIAKYSIKSWHVFLVTLCMVIINLTAATYSEKYQIGASYVSKVEALDFSYDTNTRQIIMKEKE